MIKSSKILNFMFIFFFVLFHIFSFPHQIHYTLTESDFLPYNWQYTADRFDSWVLQFSFVVFTLKINPFDNYVSLGCFLGTELFISTIFVCCLIIGIYDYKGLKKYIMIRELQLDLR